MGIGNYTQQTELDIERFAKEQADLYFDQRKSSVKPSKSENTSSIIQEMQDGLIFYISGYVNGLISHGLSEEEAFAKTQLELSSSKSKQFIDLYDRFQEYYVLRNSADYEGIGLFYGGFLSLGLPIGGLIGFLAGGGVPEFLNAGWIYTMIGLVAGLLIGIGLGQIANAVLMTCKR